MLQLELRNKSDSSRQRLKFAVELPQVSPFNDLPTYLTNSWYSYIRGRYRIYVGEEKEGRDITIYR